MMKISVWSKRNNVFISYQHIWNQNEKNELIKVIEENKRYLQINDVSVLYDILKEETWDRPEIWNNKGVTDQGRKIFVTENHLKPSNITVIIVGPYTKDRQFVDFEVATSRKQFGSLGRRKQPNGIVLLLDNKFIKDNTHNSWFDKIKKIFVKEKNDFIDYASLITEENVGKRIYNYVKNDQAVVLSFDEAIKDIPKLKAAVIAANIKSKNIIRSFDDEEDIPIMTKNEFRLATAIYTWLLSLKNNKDNMKAKPRTITKVKHENLLLTSEIIKTITNQEDKEFEKRIKTNANNLAFEKLPSTSNANFL